MNAKQKQLRQADYLEHMLDAVRFAHVFAEGLSKEDFLADKETQRRNGAHRVHDQFAMLIQFSFLGRLHGYAD